MRSVGDCLCRLREWLDSKGSFAHRQNCVQFSLVYLTPEASLHHPLNCHQEALDVSDSALLPLWKSQTSRSVIALAWWKRPSDSPLGPHPKISPCVWTFCKPLGSWRRKDFLTQRNFWDNFWSFLPWECDVAKWCKELVGQHKIFGLTQAPSSALHSDMASPNISEEIPLTVGNFLFPSNTRPFIFRVCWHEL